MDLVFLNSYLRSPWWLFRDKQSTRIKAIPLLTIKNTNTICGHAEVFGSTYINELSHEYKKYGFKLVYPSEKMSGLCIAYCSEKYDLESEPIFEKYVRSKLPDSMAPKGIFMCVFKCRYTRQKYPIIVTHLQSAYEESERSIHKVLKYREIQMLQLHQLQMFIIRNRLSNYVVMGDFNIDKMVSPILYELLMSQFNYHSKQHLLPKIETYPFAKYKIDYIFTKGFVTKPTLVLNKEERQIIEDHQISSKYISDHYGIHTFIE